MAALSQRLWRELVRLVRLNTGAGDEAEDLVQEALVRLAEYSRANEIENPQGFVLRTARNLAVSAYRRDAVRERAHADRAVIELLARTPLAQEEALATRQRLETMADAIEALPARAREVFIANRIEGLSFSQVARELGISVSAVEKNMARAIAQLTLKVKDFGRIDRQ